MCWCPAFIAAGIRPTSQFAGSFGPFYMSVLCMGLPVIGYPSRNIVMIMCRYIRDKTRVDMKVGSGPGNLVKLFVLFL